jgi:diguanylate cyclase (GGDEF)-like protein
MPPTPANSTDGSARIEGRPAPSGKVDPSIVALGAGAWVNLPPQASEQLRRLGEQLHARHDEVRERTLSRTTNSGSASRSPFVRESFERICTIATITVSHWMTSGKAEPGLEAGRDAWQIFGQLTAQREAPLHEVTKRCLHWREAADDVLREAAVELQVEQSALAKARSILQVTLDVTLVKMCEAFESERRRTDEELSRREDELSFMATHDALTGLANRTLILDRGQQMVVRSHRQQTPVAALSIDIDNFKSINDSFGHGAGDQILKAFTRRLDGVLRGSDALARVGGDEFMVVADDVSLSTGPELIAERLLEALKEPFSLGGRDLLVTASVGVAIGRRASAEELLRDADIAMYRAKWEGKNRYVVFESGMQDAAQTQLELEMDLRKALDKGEFFLVYQPTFDLPAMHPKGMEALIRWRHPRRGVVAPDDFIPLLEETGLITEVGRWVLREASSQGARWRKEGHEIDIAVNVSARQLDADDLLVELHGALADSGLPPCALTLEITETVLMRNAEETARRLSAIKALGVRIAIDDFGTGYSSLAHLQRFPVDSLKIDRSFVSQLMLNPEGETLMRTLVALGKALSIETLAEGIEDERQLALLRELRCDSGQGFLFSRPLEADDVKAFLREWDAARLTPLAAG